MLGDKAWLAVGVLIHLKGVEWGQGKGSVQASFFSHQTRKNVVVALRIPFIGTKGQGQEKQEKQTQTNRAQYICVQAAQYSWALKNFGIQRTGIVQILLAIYCMKF